MEEYLISDSLKNTYRESTSTKSISNRNTTKCTRSK